MLYVTTHGHGRWRAVPKHAGKYFLSLNDDDYRLFKPTLICLDFKKIRKKVIDIVSTFVSRIEKIIVLFIIDFAELAQKGFVHITGLERCGKSCRLRWINYLRPDPKRGTFSAHEEKLITDLHAALGNTYACLDFRNSNKKI